jgi:hypothetical protein
MVLHFMYAIIGECQEPRAEGDGPCLSTWCLVLWELPEDVTFQNGDTSPMNHLRDQREAG